MRKTLLNRRHFLSLSGAAAASLALPQVSSSLPALKGSSPLHNQKTKEIPTICGMCDARCLAVAKVKAGKFLSLEGRANNPWNGQSLCARAHAAARLLYDPDRLKYPMKRIGKRGQGKWVRINWAEAIDTISLQIEKALHAYGPPALALYAKGPSARYIQELFAEFSVPHMNDSSFEYCGRNRELAYRLVFGHDVSNTTLDYPNSKCVVLLGSHLGENVHVPEVKRLQAALGNGARLIVVDPRFSAVAAKAEFHLAIRPGTDTALIYGWLNYLIDTGQYNVGHVANNLEGFSELRKAVSAYPLERVAAITGLTRDQIEQTARAISKAAPATIIHPGRFANWHGNDVTRLHAQAVLTGFLGAWGSVGGVRPLNNDWQQDVEESGPVSANQQRLQTLLGNRDALGTTIEKKMNSGAIRVVGCWGQNPMQAHGNPLRLKKALEKVDFIFACDVLPSDTSLYADIILPEASFLERYDVIEHYSEAEQDFVSTRFPVVDPVYEAKDPYWIVKQLSIRLGRGTGFSYNDVENRLNRDLKPFGLTLKQLYAKGGVSTLPTKYETGQLHATPSGKIEYNSSSLEQRGLSSKLAFVDVPRPPTGYACLLSGRAPMHTLTSTMNNTWLLKEMPENELWLNEDIARRMAVRDGDRLFLENQDGIRTFKPVLIKVTPGIRPDCVYLVHGFGQRSHLLQQGFDRGVSDSYLTSRTNKDSISAGAALRTNYVRFVRNGHPLQMPSFVG